MKNLGIVLLILGIASVATAGDLSLKIIPESLEVGRNTAFCGVVEIMNQGPTVLEFGCPTPTSGTLAFEIKSGGETILCQQNFPLNPRKTTILGTGESVYVPFLVMITDKCNFIFTEKYQYDVVAFVDFRSDDDKNVTFDKCPPVSVNVFDWEWQEEWKKKTWGCAPLLAFGIELTMRQIDEFRGSEPLKVMTPYLMGSGRTLQSLWRNDKVRLEEIYKMEKIGEKGDTVGVAMWNYLTKLDKSLEEMPVFLDGDYVVGF